MHVSFNPDPGAIAIKAFHMSWKPCLSYVFRPFCLYLEFCRKFKRKSNSDSCGRALANADLVAANDRTVDTTSNNFTQHKDNSLPPQ